MIREFLVDCPPPPATDGLPDALTMMVGGAVNSTWEAVNDTKTTACVPVEYPERPTVKADFAVCVQVCQGIIYPSHREGVGWGVHLILFYTFPRPAPTGRVLRVLTPR